jgi:hypothetical protein
MGAGTEEMSGIAYAGGMLVAFIIDLIGILVPILGTIFISLMSLSFMIARYDMRKTTSMAVTNGLLELLPIVPGCMVFMWRSHRQNKINVKERKENAGKDGLFNSEMLA